MLSMIAVNFFPCPRRRRGSEFFFLVAPGGVREGASPSFPTHRCSGSCVRCETKRGGGGLKFLNQVQNH